MASSEPLEASGERAVLYWWVLPLLFAAAALPTARLAGWIEWPWALALAPFTALGALGIAAAAWVLVGPEWRRIGAVLGLRTEDTRALTPPPDHLEAPAAAREAGEAILLRHPEILAAVCHGLRFGRLAPEALGQPTSDPWAVYAAALEASASDLASLRMLAGLHTRRAAKRGLEKLGRMPSDKRVLDHQAIAFRKCAKNLQQEAVHPDCTFEHITAMFGSRAPSRDDALKAAAPLLRTVLEDQFPQLATASLSDGSHVRFAEWQERAARDREELDKLRKEHERLGRRAEETAAELEDARAHADALHQSVEAIRLKAREEARAEQADVVRELRSTLERRQMDHARDFRRVEIEMEGLRHRLDGLAAERDSLARALFDTDEPSENGLGAKAPSFAFPAGMKVLLVGGHEGQVPSIRERVEEHGMILLHEDSPAAAELVRGVTLVVLWVRYVSHSTGDAVRKACAAAGVPCLYWNRTSPTSFLRLLDRVEGRSDDLPS